MPFQLNIFLAWILLPVGLAVLIKGADLLVEGAVAISENLGISPLIVGLTVVAMGTSAPEVAASITATLQGDPSLAIGNVFGSNIANIALVGGVCAIIRPIIVNLTVLKREIPALLVSSLMLIPMMYNLCIGRVESALLLLVFGVIIFVSVHLGLKDSKEHPEQIEKIEEEIHEKEAKMPGSLPKAIVYLIIGLIALAVGANVTLESAKFIGYAFGMTEAVVGLTIVAIGTSLPELLTCGIAALKGHDDISIGNIVGSNVFNTLLVIGAAGMVKPLDGIDTKLINVDYWIMMAVSVIFLLIAWKFKKIGKVSGILLAVFYIAYLVLQFLTLPESA